MQSGNIFGCDVILRSCRSLDRSELIKCGMFGLWTGEILKMPGPVTNLFLKYVGILTRNRESPRQSFMNG